MVVRKKKCPCVRRAVGYLTDQMRELGERPHCGLRCSAVWCSAALLRVSREPLQHGQISTKPSEDRERKASWLSGRVVGLLARACHVRFEFKSRSPIQSKSQLNRSSDQQPPQKLHFVLFHSPSSSLAPLPSRHLAGNTGRKDPLSMLPQQREGT